MARTRDVGGFEQLFSALDELEHRAEARLPPRARCRSSRTAAGRSTPP